MLGLGPKTITNNICPYCHKKFLFKKFITVVSSHGINFKTYATYANIIHNKCWKLFSNPYTSKKLALRDGETYCMVNKNKPHKYRVTKNPVFRG